MRGQKPNEEHRSFMALLLLLTFAAVALLIGCDNGGTVPTPLPSPTPVAVASPSPRPTTAPVAACYWPDNPTAAKAKCAPDSSPGNFVREMDEAMYRMVVLHPEFFRKIEIEELMPDRVGDAGDFLEDEVTRASGGMVCAAYRLTTDDEIAVKGDNARSETIDWLMGDYRLRHRGHVQTCTPAAF